MTFICDVTLCVSIMEVIFHFHVFRYQFFFVCLFFFWNLSKRVKLVVECEFLFFFLNIIKKSLKNLKKTHSLKDLKKTLITENLTRNPITDNLQEISTLKNLKRTLSLSSGPQEFYLRSFRTVNDFGPQK